MLQIFIWSGVSHRTPALAGGIYLYCDFPLGDGRSVNDLLQKLEDG